MCVSSIKKAIEHDETNPEGYQVLAEYHLIKGEMLVCLDYTSHPAVCALWAGRR